MCNWLLTHFDYKYYHFSVVTDTWHTLTISIVIFQFNNFSITWIHWFYQVLRFRWTILTVVVEWAPQVSAGSEVWAAVVYRHGTAAVSRRAGPLCWGSPPLSCSTEWWYRSGRWPGCWIVPQPAAASWWSPDPPVWGPGWGGWCSVHWPTQTAPHYSCVWSAARRKTADSSAPRGGAVFWTCGPVRPAGPRPPAVDSWTPHGPWLPQHVALSGGT